jgi:hypothetical protein
LEIATGSEESTTSARARPVREPCQGKMLAMLGEAHSGEALRVSEETAVRRLDDRGKGVTAKKLPGYGGAWLVWLEIYEVVALPNLTCSRCSR